MADPMLESPAVDAHTRKVYQVGELTRRIKYVLEDEIGSVWVEGEISNLSRPASGHFYFTLKDHAAALRSVFFKGSQRGMTLDLQDGQLIRACGEITVYEKSGQYQLIVRSVEAGGQGSLQAAFEKLKQKLQAEGLFETSRKRRLPLLPRHIGIVTSASGAAIRDMLNVLRRRFPNLHILVAPVKVQGDQAAGEIAEAIDRINEHGIAEVIIVGRGGGSLEDLWAFNEEAVARAIARSRIPIISAVGHEVDFSISDFVADLRAPTPSAAAELVVTAKEDFESELRHHARRLVRALEHLRLELKNRFIRAGESYVFKEPAHRVRRGRQQIQMLQDRLRTALTGASRDQRHLLREQRTAMAHLAERALRDTQQHLDELDSRLGHRVGQQTTATRQRLERIRSQLRALNPHAVLERGFSITRTAAGTVLRDAGEASAGAEIITRLAQGSLVSTISIINPENEDERKESA